MLETLEYGFYGALIFQMSFMFILFLQNQKKAYYIYYSLYILGIFLAMEPKILGIRHAFVFVLEWPIILFYFLFLESFLQLNTVSPTYKKVFSYLKPIALSFFLLQLGLTFAKEFFGPMEIVDSITHRFDDFIIILTFLFGCYTLAVTYRLKNALSIYILIGTSALLIGAILNKLVIVTGERYSIIIGTFIELLLFSAAVGYKTNLIEAEKRKTQEQLMQANLLALRDQMSPHFIANCLNSIKLLIQQKKEKEAVEYLTEFSKLHRLIVEHFKDMKVSLKKELTICKSYLEMEKLRFKQSFNYAFDIKADDNLLTFVEVPPLLFQPIIENAIWHGLMKKEGCKNLMISVESTDSYLTCTIEDNGIGRPAAIKDPDFIAQPQSQKSTGLSNTLEKITVFNELYHTNILIDLIDKHNEMGQPSGFKVVFTLFYD
ncbi:MAG: histidine kinase [Saprospiraceae bacterium]